MSWRSRSERAWRARACLWVIALVAMAIGLGARADAQAPEAAGERLGLVLPTAGEVLAEAWPTGQRLRVDGFDLWMRPAEPMLPYRTLRVLLPRDADPDSVTLELGDLQWEDLPAVYDLAPAPPLATLGPDGPLLLWGDTPTSLLTNGRNRLVYAADGYWPRQPAQLTSVGAYRQWQFVELSLFPLQYNAARGTLRRLTEGQAVLRYRRLPEAPMPIPATEERFWEHFALGLANADDRAAFYPQTFLPATSDVDTSAVSDYVIITTAAIQSGSSQLAAFVQAKERQGFTVKVVTEASSADSTHYKSGSSVGTRADNIRSWLAGRYVADGIAYVLLIGHPDPSTYSASYSVPMKMTYPRSSDSTYRESPTDMYYSDLSGNWNPDGDAYVGEASEVGVPGGIDRTPEVYVGRIPFYGSFTDLDAILAKTIAYGEDTGDVSWRKKLLAPVAISNHGPQDDNNDGIVDVPLAYRTFGDDWGEYLKALAAGNGFSAYTLYEKVGVYSDGSAYPLTPASAALNTANLLAEWAQGYGFVSWWGHGNETGAYQRQWTSDNRPPNPGDRITQIGETVSPSFITSGGLSSLNDLRPSFVAQVSCTNGKPEDANNLSYSLLKKGAIGTVGSSRVSWYFLGPWEPENYADNASFGYYLLQRMAVSGESVGQALAQLRSGLNLSTDSSTKAALWMNCTDNNLYGDPSLGLNSVGQAAPTVSGVSPAQGPAGGGTTVTLSGTGFKSGAAVTFGGVTASSVIVISSTQIVGVTPAHLPEAVDVQVTNSDGKSGLLLRGFTFVGEQASLRLPDLVVEQGAVVDIPIDASDISELVAAGITILFDSSVLTPLSARTGDLTAGWSLAANTSTPGQARLSMVGSSSATGSGTLAVIEAQVTGASGVSTTLGLADVLLNDGAIPYATTDGSLQVETVYRIEGTVNYWATDVGVDGAALTLEGAQSYQALSGADGRYALQGIRAGSYNLAPSKVDGVAGITALDASRVLRHDAGSELLSGAAWTAADVNKSGFVTAMDAYYILRQAAGLIAPPFNGAGRVWDFAPPSRSYSDLDADQAGQDWTAILLGDVTGNWAPAGSGGVSASGETAMQAANATLTISSLATTPGQPVVTPVTLAIEDAALYGVDLTLTYDPTVLAAVRVDKGALAANWTKADNLSTPGVIRVSLAGAQAITQGGELLQIVFDTVGAVGASTEIAFAQADLNEGEIPVTTDGGSVTVYMPAVAAFTETPTSGIAPLMVTFTNASTGDYDTYAWDFGDGGESAVENPTHTYETPGLYTVALTVSGNGGADTETKAGYIAVYAPVGVAFGATPLSGPAPLTVDFTNLSTGDHDTYAWSFGDGGESAVENPTHVYETPGVYTVTLTASGLGGTGTETKAGYITVYAPAQASFAAAPTDGIAPLSVSFTNTSTGDVSAYAWAFGDGEISALESPTHVYETPGVYTVTLTVQGDGGQDTAVRVGYITVRWGEISGVVRYWNDSRPVSGASLDLSGDLSATAATGADGAYTLGSLRRGSYVVAPSKAGGDGDAITPYDASLILRHATGQDMLGGQALLAADVTLDGTASAFDASYILRKAAQLIALPFPGVGQTWLFDPEDRAYGAFGEDVTAQDYVAVLMGDVSGNWGSGNDPAISASSPVVTLRLATGEADAAGYVTVTVDLDTAATIYSLDLALTYDADSAQAEGIALGAILSDWLKATNTQEPGQVHLAVAGAQPVSGTGRLLSLRFKLATPQSQLALQVAGADVDEGSAQVIVRDDYLPPTYYLPIVFRQ